MKTALLLLFIAVRCGAQPSQQLPDNQQPVKAMPLRYAHKRSGDIRSRIFTRKFIAAHSVFLGSIVYDAEITHQGIAHHKCVEANADVGRHPSRGGLYQDSLIPFVAMFGFDVLTQWMRPPKALSFISYMAPAYGTTLHVRGGTRWLTGCW